MMIGDEGPQCQKPTGSKDVLQQQAWSEEVLAALRVCRVDRMKALLAVG